MENLVIESGINTLEICHNSKHVEQPICIDIYQIGCLESFIFISLDQAKQIRDYLDNILKSLV